MLTRSLFTFAGLTVFAGSAIARGVLGPMAYAMMGGIIAGTVLTLLLLVLLSLYVPWFRIKERARARDSTCIRLTPRSAPGKPRQRSVCRTVAEENYL